VKVDADKISKIVAAVKGKDVLQVSKFLIIN
jgi:hypothetical protein